MNAQPTVASWGITTVISFSQDQNADESIKFTLNISTRFVTKSKKCVSVKGHLIQPS